MEQWSASCIFEGPAYYKNCEFREYHFNLAYQGFFEDGSYLDKCNIYEGDEVRGYIKDFINGNESQQQEVNTNFDYSENNWDGETNPKSLIMLGEWNHSSNTLRPSDDYTLLL